MPVRIRKLILSQKQEIDQICHVGGDAGGLQLGPALGLQPGGGKAGDHRAAPAWATATPTAPQS